MEFNSPASVEMVVWQMILAAWPRARNRARINDLFNGFPPYPPEYSVNHPNNTNVNFLEPTKIFNDAQRQMEQGLLAPDPLFTVKVDYGPVHKRMEWSDAVTNRIGRMLKKSIPYYQLGKCQISNDVLHGTGPAIWLDRESWRPKGLGLEDVLMPDGVTLEMDNLQMFVPYRKFTPMQLYKMTSGPRVDPGWNMPLVEKALAWAEEQMKSGAFSTSWPATWSPEKMAERIKSDSGLYASAAVPTIDVFDMYYWSDEKKNCGWRRKMILDSWGNPALGAIGVDPKGFDDRALDWGKDQFLYDSSKRRNSKYADRYDQIIHFQFANCSPIAPFHYDSIRGMGFLLWAVCNLQNRMRCKFNDHVFENLMQYFRVSNPQDEDRVTTINLLDKAVIKDGVFFLKQEERWQINLPLFDRAAEMNRQSMTDNSASFNQDFDLEKQQEETATRTMAKVNSTAAMVGAMHEQVYRFQVPQYEEIKRRFCIPNSKDPEVRQVRNLILKDGVPEEALVPERLEVQPNRAVGSGSKMLRVAMADKVMAINPTLDPSIQNKVKRFYLEANLDDYQLAKEWTPDAPTVSRTMHDTEIVAGILFGGNNVTPEPGLNSVEVVDVMLVKIQDKIQEIQQTDNMGTPQVLLGLNLAEKYTQGFIDFLAQDESETQRVTAYQKALSKMMDEVKGFTQRLTEKNAAANGAANGAPQPDPADVAKAQNIAAQGELKRNLAEQSHAEKTAQRRISFEEKTKQDQQKHELEMAKTAAQAAQEIHVQGLKHAADLAAQKSSVDKT